MNERVSEFRTGSQSLLEAAEGFLYREAELLDEDRLEEWASLFTDDGRYWIPSNRFDIDPSKHVCVVYADKARLQEIIVRARSGTFWAQEPRSRVSRLLGNVQIDGQLPVCNSRSRFLVTEIRRGQSRVFSGTYRHQLLFQNGQWKIQEKLVQLINNDEPLDNLTFLL
jgi:3-phenylpropionate/cinnamic acid dioxygenase small subunit